jgi:hypothetical protein
MVMREYRAEHELTVDGRVLSEGDCDIHLDDEFLMIKGTRAHRIAYEEIEAIRLVGSAVELSLHPEGVVRIRVLDGALARPFFLHLSRLRGARWADLLRFVDGEILDSLECKFALDSGEEGEALARLYPVSLVVLPLGVEPVQLPLYEMETIQFANYRLRCATPYFSATLFGCEPGDLARVHRSIVGARRKIDEETAVLLEELFPALEFAQRTRLTDLLLRGKAASKRDIDSSVPWLWGRIEELIRGNTKTWEAYAHLRAHADDRLWFGLRRLTDLEKLDTAKTTEEEAEEAMPGETRKREPHRDFLFWLLAGLEAEGKRFVAVEVAAPEKGYATYVYRTLDAPGEEQAFNETVGILSRCLVALNFLREPLFARQSEIDTGKFAQYKLALRKLDYLRTARNLFVGRAIHTKTWQASLEKLIS